MSEKLKKNATIICNTMYSDVLQFAAMCCDVLSGVEVSEVEVNVAEVFNSR